jgi:hypothetical protein
MNSSRTRAFAALVTSTVLVALAAAGCGDDDSPSAANTAASSTTSTVVPGRIEVEAIDYAFEELPERVARDAKFTLHNASKTELHEMVVFRLPDGETRSAVELSRLPEAELEALFTGEPAMVLIASPGEDAFNALGDGVLKEPGRYVVFCAIPQGADPQEYLQAAESGDGPPQVEGGPPHFTLGMVGDVTVE